MTDKNASNLNGNLQSLIPRHGWSASAGGAEPIRYQRLLQKAMSPLATGCSPCPSLYTT